MTPRERFKAVMDFEKGVPTLKAEYGYWVTTITNFIDQGMPVSKRLPADISLGGTVSGAVGVGSFDTTVVDENIRSLFDLDPYPSKFPFDVSPMLPEEVLERGDAYNIVRDKYGITKKVLTSGTSTPLDLDFPIKSRKDFEQYKEHYSRPVADRLPKEWDTVKRGIKDRDFPIRLGGFPFGFLGLPRHLIGTAELFMLMYDDPGLIKEMNAFFLQFVMEYWDVLIRDIDPDFVLIWEDMASKTGSMISKEMFEEFLSPFYRELIDFLKQHHITNIHVDSDGYIEELLPLWTDLGVTGLFPFEIQANNNMLRIREEFPRLQILGAVDKRILMANKSRQDIDAELTIAEKLLGQGGYIPHADHHVPDDAVWENFSYYRNRLNDLVDAATEGGG